MYLGESITGVEKMRAPSGNASNQIPLLRKGKWGNSLVDGVGALSRAVIALRITRKRMPSRQSEVHRSAGSPSSSRGNKQK